MQDFVLHELFASSGKVAVSVRKTVKGTSNMNARDFIVGSLKIKNNLSFIHGARFL
jgi:hypothetical protein